jgi:hypothetical protein
VEEASARTGGGCHALWGGYELTGAGKSNKRKNPERREKEAQRAAGLAEDDAGGYM